MPYKNCLFCDKKANNKSKKKLKIVLRTTKRKMSNDYFKNLDKINAVIDNKAPPLCIENVLKSQKHIGDFKRLQQVFIENQNILKRMDIIFRTKGIIDSYNHSAGIRYSKLQKTYNEINQNERDNIVKFKRLMTIEPIIKNSYFVKCWKYNLNIIRCQSTFPLILPGLTDNQMDVIEWTESLNDLKTLKNRSKVFIELSMANGRNLGCLKLLLFDEIVPKTVANFLTLIKNIKLPKRSELDCVTDNEMKTFPNYIGTPLHRIFPSLYIETGDITKGNGIGGQSANGLDFPPENFLISAKYTGTLAMIPTENGYVNSKFLITFKPLSLLDGKRVVFGRVIKGLDRLKAIEIYGRKHGKPQENIIISNCGVLRK